MPLTLKNFNRQPRPITTAGIYHNSNLGLISLSSNGTNWTTIADKNLGATQVWNSGDTLSEANCGKYYQRGNNYGFAWTGSVTTSSSTVNASTYGPGNYYSSSTFITSSSSPYGWDYSNNDNLRGDTTGGYVARQGPCDIGFHIPGYGEWGNIYSIFQTLYGGNSPTKFGEVIKLPFAGRRDNSTSNVANQGSAGFYWETSFAYSGSKCYGYRMYFTSSAVTLESTGYTTLGHSIRAFRNEARPPMEGESGWVKLL